MISGSEKPGFCFKNPKPLDFGGFYYVLGFVGFLDFLNQQLGSLLVDLSRQLSFYSGLSVLWVI